MTGNYLRAFDQALRMILSKDPSLTTGKRSITVSKAMTSDLVRKLDQLGWTVTVKHDKYSDGIYIE